MRIGTAIEHLNPETVEDIFRSAAWCDTLDEGLAYIDQQVAHHMVTATGRCSYLRDHDLEDSSGDDDLVIAALQKSRKEIQYD